MTIELASSLILGIVVLAVASVLVVLIVEYVNAPAPVPVRISSDTPRHRMDRQGF